MARPDPSLLQGVVAREVLDAMRVASLALKRAGVRHVVVGGLAVGVWAKPRATMDIDLAVATSALAAARQALRELGVLQTGRSVTRCRPCAKKYAPSIPRVHCLTSASCRKRWIRPSTTVVS